MRRTLALTVALALVAALLLPEVANAATSLNQVIENLRNWLIGLLAALLDVQRSGEQGSPRVSDVTRRERRPQPCSSQRDRRVRRRLRVVVAPPTDTLARAAEPCVFVLIAGTDRHRGRAATDVAQPRKEPIQRVDSGRPRTTTRPILGTVRTGAAAAAELPGHRVSGTPSLAYLADPAAPRHHPCPHALTGQVAGTWVA
jgi:hypothetical protein